MKRSQVCIDASLALQWLIPAQKSPATEFLLINWVKKSTSLVAPPLFPPEVSSTIRLNVYLNKLTPEEGETAFANLLDLDIKTVNHPGLCRKAWYLAKQYNRSRTYDMQYLALAELEDCELWTADKRLINSLKGRSRRIRLVGENE